jgi:hypothetical protein
MCMYHCWSLSSICVTSGRCVQTVITGSALLAISGTDEQYVALYRQTEELNGVVPHQQLPPHTATTATANTAASSTNVKSSLPLYLTATATVAAPAAAAVQQHALIRGTGRTPGIRSSATSSSNSSSSTTSVHNDWSLPTVRHNSTTNSSSKASSSSNSSSCSAAAVQKAVAGRDVVIADLGGLLFERRYTKLIYVYILHCHV